MTDTEGALHLQEEFVCLEDFLPSILTDLRYCSVNNFIGEPVDGYEAARAILSKAAAASLVKVQEELSLFGLGLKIFDAYRPQRAVDHFVRWAKKHDDNRMKPLYYPNIDKEQLIPDGYIIPRSSHSRGSTVDLTIITNSGGRVRELDMGSPFDFFDPISWPGNLGVTAQQRANRMLLSTVMGNHGFVPLAQEWWHFTLANEPFPDTYFDFPVR